MLLYNYVDTPNSNLLCCICRAPFTDPITTLTCQHTFCRECITNALSHSPQCPVDRSPLGSDDLGPVNPIVRSLVDELLVECVYSEEGCKYQGQRQLLAAHLKDECAFSDAGKLRSADSKGKCVENGEKDPETNLSESRTEGSDTTQRSTSPLSESASASSSTSPFTTSAEKASQPSSSHRICHLTEQNILLRHRVDTLEGAVQTLRREMACVRTVLNPWMQNAAIPSCNWGTPTRNAGSQVSGSGESRPNMSPAVQPPTNNNTSNSGSSSSSTRLPPDNTPRGSPGEGGSRLDDDGNDLASYFPADDEVRVRRTSPVAPPPQERPAAPQQITQVPAQPQQQRRTGHLHHHSVPSIPGVTLEGHPAMSPALQSLNYLGSPYVSMGLYGSLLPPPTTMQMQSVNGPPPHPLSGGPQYQPQPGSTTSISVPDLDTSSPSLSTTLQGLHSNVVSLAASIEEIHKKSDLALVLMGGGTGAALPGGGVVGEVLRLGEEVMGVRATVQGLRMQMHGLMMGNVGVGTGAMGFAAGRPPPQPINAKANGEEGSAESYGMPPHLSQGLQNQRFVYPVPPGITKL